MFGRSDNPKGAVVPVVELKGVIQAGGRGSPFSGSKFINIDAMRDKLKEAFNTAGAVAVALDINSPGGSPTQSELVGQLIRDLAEEKNIPVYAFAQDVAASGGYWLACAADEIYAAKTSTIGSIGVVTGGLGLEDLAQKVGVKNRTFTAGKAKRRMNPLEPVKAADEAWMKDRLEKMHEIFKDWIMERRGDRLVVPAGQDPKQYLDDHVFTGDTWFGQESVDMGLIDGVGHMEDILKEKFGDDVVIKYQKDAKKGLLAKMLFTAFGSAAAPDTGLPERPVQELVEAAAEVMKKEAIWQRFDMR